jgi:hypothetical protein
MLLAAEKGDITTIIGGIAPDWGPFGSLGNEARVMIEVVMAVAILLCLGIAIWGAAKQRIGATALRDTFSAEQGKGLIIAGLTGVPRHAVHDRVRHGGLTRRRRPALFDLPHPLHHPSRRAHRLRLRLPDVQSPHRARAGTSTATVVRGLFAGSAQG